MDDERRGYALVTPTLKTEEDGTQKISMESRVFTLSNDALAEAGLENIVVEDGQAERYGVTDPDSTKALLERLSEMGGVKVLGVPNLATAPGEESQMHAEAASGANVHIYLQPSLATNGTGYDLRFDFGTGQPVR